MTKSANPNYAGSLIIRGYNQREKQAFSTAHKNTEPF